VSQCRHTLSLRFLDFDGAVRLRHGKQARRGAAQETQTRAFAPVCFRRVEAVGTTCFGPTSEYLRYLSMSRALKSISVRVSAVEGHYPNVSFKSHAVSPGLPNFTALAQVLASDQRSTTANLAQARTARPSWRCGFKTRNHDAQELARSP
jgi:hypothetical protein